MAAEPLSPRLSTSSRPKFPKHDTGFPEPFNGVSNTTLPHPEANLSPDAVICQEDINFTGFMRRSRRPFRNKSKRTISHGRITATMEALYGRDAPIEEEDEDGLESPMESQAVRSRSGSSINPSRPGVLSVSTGRPSTSRDADSIFSNTNGDMSPTTSTSSIKKKGSVFRRLRFLK